jgi:exodeoxyribonuclease V beta subunit
MRGKKRIMTNRGSVNTFTEYSLDGINCIEASAGTGKTYTISHLYLRLIIEKGLSIDNILVVTFTNAATDEIRSRIRSLIAIAHDMLEERCDASVQNKYAELYNYLHWLCNDATTRNYRTDKETIKEKLQLALSDIDKAHIYTIHSFCSRTLNEFAFESRSLFGSQLIEDERPYMRRVVEDFYYTTIAPLGQEFVALFYQEKKDFVSWLLKLLRKLPDDPHIRILPQITFEPQELKQQLHLLTQKIESIRKKFTTDFDAIKENYYKALAEKVLNSRSYKEEDINTLENTILKLSIYTALDDDINKSINKFSISGLVSKLIGQYKEGKKKYTWHEFFTLLEECREIIINIKIQVIAAYREFIDYSELQYTQYRERWNIISFRDILKDMQKALAQGTESPLALRVRERFKAALIDEFQDTDPLQYAIFTTIFKKEGYTLYIIGDPKQAIYSFRGADVFAYIKARRSADNIYTLHKSYRSTPSLTRAINYIFGRLKDPFIFSEIQYYPVESQIQDVDFFKNALHIWFIENNEDSSIPIGVARKIIAKNIVTEIQNLVNSSFKVDGKALQYSDIAILVHRHHEAELVQGILRQYGINSVLYSRQSIFATPEVWELLHVLEAIIHPSSTTAIKRAMVTSLFGYCGNDIIQMEQQGSLDNIKMQCATYLNVWKSKGFIVMVQQLLHDGSIVNKKNGIDTVAKNILQYTDGERVITNILHCAEILADAERRKKLDPLALVEWLKRSMYDAADIEDEQLRLESDANAVKIVTIHASKGLEYPIVFCPYLFNVSSLDDIFVFHDNEDDNYKTNISFKFNKNQIEEKALLFEDDDYEQIKFVAECEQLAESLRIAYVAITRAKYKCYIGWGNINTTKKSALRYLFHFNNSTDSITNFINGIDHTSQELLKDLKSIEEQSGGVITVQCIKDQVLPLQSTVQSQQMQPQSIKTLTKSIQPGWQLTSYTSLSYKRDDEKNDELQVPVITKEEAKELSIFTFPAGSIPGLCIHKIFETIEFNADNKEIVQAVSDILKKYNIDTMWTDVIAKMVSNVLTVPLQAKFASLSHITSNQRRHEVEFYYPIEHLDSKRLIELFREQSLFTMKYANALEQLNFADISGFMHGYIDMVFEYENAFYIVDWKSNLLGTSIEAYHTKKLEDAVCSHLYFLQYNIYAVALHRYLKLLLRKTYRYEKNFGGVFYIFVRGVDASLGSEYGIFYDKPDATFIGKLDSLLGRVTI